ncbi:MAG: YdcF family protein [Oscillospiraceae bacterium]|nr:YdcF family protein [Oscillospiraceae bacterium]
MRKQIAWMAAASLLCGILSGCGSALQNDSAPSSPAPETSISAAAESSIVLSENMTENELLEQIITLHGCYDHAADDKVNALLKELGGRDERKGKLWTDIMEYWDYANNELKVNVDEVPDDLPQDDTLALAVLGFELNPDGTMQDELVGRLEVALKCAEHYPNAYVICTGGGTAMGAPDVTEGRLMGDWMLAHGLAGERLIVEDQSHTTAENAENSYDILLRDYPQVNSVMLISSSYHIAWGSLLFEAGFLRSASEKQTPEIHVRSNCSCPITNDKYLWSEILRWETGGMLQMIGNTELALQYYSNYDNVKKPVL